MAKVTFINNPHPFKTLLDQRIDSYFETNQIAQRGNWKLYSKTAILFLSLSAVYAAILSNQPGLRCCYAPYLDLFNLPSVLT